MTDYMFLFSILTKDNQVLENNELQCIKIQKYLFIVQWCFSSQSKNQCLRKHCTLELIHRNDSPSTLVPSTLLIYQFTLEVTHQMYITDMKRTIFDP